MITLTKTRLVEGVWEGVLTYSGGGNFQPDISVTHLDQPIGGVVVTENTDEGYWTLRVPIPATLISDGLQTFLILDARTGDTLGSFAVLAGDALAEDLRAEVDLLRAELDMLKKAFRRHCVETMG